MKASDTPKAEPSKPVMFSDNRTDAERFDPRLHRGALDPSRIPGYSEIVTANDLDRADDLTFRDRNNGLTKEKLFRQIGATPQALPVEFQWLPVNGVSGGVSAHVDRVLDGYKNQQGFRVATEADLSEHGYGFPPSARRAEDGTIRRGSDTALFVRSREVADMWDAFKVETQRDFEGDTTRTATSGGYETEVEFAEQGRESVTVKH